MTNNLAAGNAHALWISQLKNRFQQVQIKAAVADIAELLQFYCE